MLLFALSLCICKITGGALFDRSSVQVARSKESGRYSVDTAYWTRHHEERPYIEEVFKRTADSRASSACTDFARIGGDGDGGKIICMENENHDSMSFRIGSQAKSDKPCVIYSLGSNAQFGFERVSGGCSLSCGSEYILILDFESILTTYLYYINLFLECTLI